MKAFSIKTITNTKKVTKIIETQKLKEMKENIKRKITIKKE